MKKYDPICSSGGPNDHDPKMQEIRTGEYLKVNDVKAAVICKMFDLKAALVSNDIIEAFKIITEFKYDINKL